MRLRRGVTKGTVYRGGVNVTREGLPYFGVARRVVVKVLRGHVDLFGGAHTLYFLQTIVGGYRAKVFAARSVLRMGTTRLTRFVGGFKATFGVYTTIGGRGQLICAQRGEYCTEPLCTLGSFYCRDYTGDGNANISNEGGDVTLTKVGGQGTRPRT